MLTRSADEMEACTRSVTVVPHPPGILCKLDSCINPTERVKSLTMMQETANYSSVPRLSERKAPFKTPFCIWLNEIKPLWPDAIN